MTDDVTPVGSALSNPGQQRDSMDAGTMSDLVGGGVDAFQRAGALSDVMNSAAAAALSPPSYSQARTAISDMRGALVDAGASQVGDIRAQIGATNLRDRDASGPESEGQSLDALTERVEALYLHGASFHIAWSVARKVGSSIDRLLQSH